jgi:hypothetical protein
MLDVHSECSFYAKSNAIFREALIHLYYDLYPVNSGHLLVTPNRHMANFSPLSAKRVAPVNLPSRRRYFWQPSIPDNYNVGVNLGVLVGQRHACPSYIKRAFRKRLKVRVQGADRRECRLPFQGPQRGNRALSGFPQGEIQSLGPASKSLSSKCAFYIRHYTSSAFQGRHARSQQWRARGRSGQTITLLFREMAT